jgi:hypothetical protein
MTAPLGDTVVVLGIAFVTIGVACVFIILASKWATR